MSTIFSHSYRSPVRPKKRRQSGTYRILSAVDDNGAVFKIEPSGRRVEIISTSSYISNPWNFGQRPSSQQSETFTAVKGEQIALEVWSQEREHINDKNMYAKKNLRK